MFKLSNEPVDYQLTVHFSNLVQYADSTKPVLNAVNDICRFESCIAIYLNSRKTSPIHFRCAQLISHYGKDVILNYIKMIYGENK